MITVPFLAWTDIPSARGPTSVIAVNFGADPSRRIRLNGGYHDASIDARVVVADNSGNAVSCAITFNGVSNFVPANVRVSFPLAPGTNTADIQGASGTVNLQFFADARDAPPDQPNYLGLISQAIVAAIPTGIIWPFGGSVAPSGYLICDGSAIGRAVFANLFAVIGTQYGIGDGVTTFNIPDGRDAAFIGASPGGLGPTRPSVRAIGASGGEETNLLTGAEIPFLTVTTAFQGAGAVSGNAAAYMRGNGVTGTESVINFLNGTGGQAHNNMSPFFVGTWIIKT